MKYSPVRRRSSGLRTYRPYRHNPSFRTPARVLLLVGAVGGTLIVVDLIGRKGALPQIVQDKLHETVPERYPPHGAPSGPDKAQGDRSYLGYGGTGGGGALVDNKPVIPPSVVALDLGNGTVQNHLQYADGRRVPLGLPYARTGYGYGTPPPAHVAPPERMEAELSNGYSQLWLVYPDGHMIQEGNPYPTRRPEVQAPVGGGGQVPTGRPVLTVQQLDDGQQQQVWVYEDGSMVPAGPPFILT